MIKYKDVIDLGFKRTDAVDKVWFDTYGYEYFYLEKTLLKCKKGIKIVAIWEPEDEDVRIVKTDRDGNILSSLNFDKKHQFMEWYDFLNGNK